MERAARRKGAVTLSPVMEDTSTKRSPTTSQHDVSNRSLARSDMLEEKLKG